MIRTLWVFLVGGYLTLLYSARILAARATRRSAIPELCETLASRWGRRIIQLSGSRVTVEGLDRVEWDRPMVLVANHESWFDVFAIVGHLPMKARFVAKEELSRVPLFGGAWTSCGHVSIDRSDRSQAIESLNRARDRVRSEALAMVFFPEGTRSPDGRLQRFKKGAFVLAIQTGAPVVPVGVIGTREIMPKGSFRIRPGQIRLRLGAPIPVDDLTSEDRELLLERARAAVAALVDPKSGPIPSGGSVPDPRTHIPDAMEKPA